MIAYEHIMRLVRMWQQENDGAGMFSVVRVRRNGTVLKAVPNDEGYAAYLSAIDDCPFESKHFPVIHRVYDDGDGMLVVMEKLAPAKHYLHDLGRRCGYNDGWVITHCMEQAHAYDSMIEAMANFSGGISELSAEALELLDETFDEDLWGALQYVTGMAMDYGVNVDLHASNYMMRGDVLVITDPYYHQHSKSMSACLREDLNEGSSEDSAIVYGSSSDSMSESYYESEDAVIKVCPTDCKGDCNYCCAIC